MIPCGARWAEAPDLNRAASRPSAGNSLREMPPLRRLAAFAAVCVAAPSIAALMAAVIRASSQTALLVAVWQTDRAFFVEAVLRALGASLVLTVALWAGSLLAWGRDTPRGLVRIARLVLALWTGAFVLYPGLGSWVPGFRSLPWIAGIALLLAVLAVTLVLARPTLRELLYIPLAMMAVFWTPARTLPSLPELAGRSLDRNDVLLLGFDSMSRDDLAEVLDAFSPRAGRMVVFDQARTTVPVTSAAWRSALSGLYPRPADILPGARWPEDRRAWIPAALEQRGYRPIFFQDSPGTNTYAPDESVLVPDEQGWKAIVQEFVWKAAFPLSSAAAPRWLGLAGGPALAAGRYGYCPECFWARTLERIGQAAASGKLFAAVHSCHVHAPVHLTLAEASEVRSWWIQTPVQLEGGGNPFFDDDSEGREAILGARERSARAVVARLLKHLDETGVIGTANVVVLSDHGPRGSWVARERTERIALALFTPGQREHLRIETPVSLADVAPTVRSLLALDQVSSDGKLLPGFGGAVDASRGFVVAEPPSLEQAGVKLGTVTSDMLLRDLVLHPDGTFGYSAQLRAQFQVGDIRGVPKQDRRL